MRPAVAALGFLAAAATYYPALAHPYIHLSQAPPHALGNLGVIGFRLGALLSPDYDLVFSQGAFNPLATLVYALNARLFGPTLLGLYLAEFLLMWAAIVLLHRIGERLLESREWALLAVAVYLALPVHGLDIPTALRDILMTTFCLAGILAHQSFRENGGWPRSLACCACLLLAALAKETGVMLLPILLWHDLLGADGERAGGARRGRLAHDARLVLTAGVFAVLLLLFRAGRTPGGLWGAPAGAGVIAGRLAGYLGLLLMPDEPGALGGRGGLILAACALLGAGAAVKDSGPRRALFLSGWLLLALAPVLGVLPVAELSRYLCTEGLMRRYLRLPAPAFALLLVWGLRPYAKRAAGTPVLLACAAWAAAGIWTQARDARRLAKETALEQPAAPDWPLDTWAAVDALAYLPAACAAGEAGDCARIRRMAETRFPADAAALIRFFQTPALLLDSCKAHYYAWGLGRPRTIHELRAEVADAYADFESGCESLRRGAWKAAAAGFSGAVARDPEFREAFFFRGLVRLREGERAAAAGDYRAARRQPVPPPEWIGRYCRCLPDGAAPLLAEYLALEGR